MDTSRFKNVEYNIFLTKALFFEMTGADKSTVIYTLKDEEHEGFPSLREAYLSCEDPTEYIFANDYLGGWSHWEKLLKCTWFKPYIKRWRHELELKIKSDALRRIKAESKTDSKNAFTANRFLLEKGWTEKNTKGRPSKDDIKKAAIEKAEEHFDIAEAASRILKPESTIN